MISATKKVLKEELDKTWSERLKKMSSSLQAEMEKRHKENSDSALAELALLKDKILKEENEKWNYQKTQLLTQVSDYTLKYSNRAFTWCNFFFRYLSFKSSLKMQQNYLRPLYLKRNTCF